MVASYAEDFMRFHPFQHFDILLAFCDEISNMNDDVVCLIVIQLFEQAPEPFIQLLSRRHLKISSLQRLE